MSWLKPKGFQKIGSPKQYTSLRDIAYNKPESLPFRHKSPV